jgi:hypothetical protein
LPWTLGTRGLTEVESPCVGVLEDFGVEFDVYAFADVVLPGLMLR